MLQCCNKLTYSSAAPKQTEYSHAFELGYPEQQKRLPPWLCQLPPFSSKIAPGHDLP
jgi:hypothetical protein